MSDSGDEEGFHPHPGDPWHPEWSDESVAGEVASAPEGERSKRQRRGWFHRKAKDVPDAGVESAESAHEAARPPGAGDGECDDVPATVYGVEPSEVEVVGAAAAEPEEAPLPAWLTDLPPEEHTDPTLTVELPSWVGNTTAGAPAMVGGFEGDALVEPAEDAAEGAAPDDVEVALRALGALDEDDVEVVPFAAVDTRETLSDAEPPHLAPLDPVPEIAAAASEYGVAGKEAFEALRDIHAEDLGDWETFAGSGSASPSAGEVVPRPMETDVVAQAEPPRRRGIWPFRRNRAPEDEEVVEEPADWSADIPIVPEAWFARVDEDTVVPPPEDLPETEWPEPGPGPAPTEPGAWEVPAGAGRGGAGDRPGPERPRAADERRMTEPPSPAIPEPVPAAPDSEEYSPVVFDHGYGFDTLDAPDGSASDGRPTRPTDDALFRPPVPGRVPSRGDGGGFVPDRPATPGGEDEEWVTGPIDLGGEYDDSTVELPVGYPSVDDVGEQQFTIAATTEHRGFAEELSRAVDEDTEWQAVSAAMPGVGTGVVGFDDVADLGDEEDVYEAATRSELGTRVLTGIVLVGFLVGSVWVGGVAAAAFIGLLVVLGLGEFYGTLRRRGFRPLSVFGYLGGIGMLFATWFHGPIAIPVAIGLTAVVVFFVYAFAPLRRDALANGGLTVLGVAWVIGTAAFVVPILRVERYRVLVLSIVVVTAAMDIGAYSVGRTWGRRALAPIISPNKSVEGLIGGIVVCMAAAAAVGYMLEPFDLRSGTALGLVICVAAPIGDLAESMIKRSLGVKDMGAVLPGHGGILDRVDAFLFVLPAAWVLFQSIGLLG